MLAGFCGFTGLVKNIDQLAQLGSATVHGWCMSVAISWTNRPNVTVLKTQSHKLFGGQQFSCGTIVVSDMTT